MIVKGENMSKPVKVNKVSMEVQELLTDFMMFWLMIHQMNCLLFMIFNIILI